MLVLPDKTWLVALSYRRRKCFKGKRSTWTPRGLLWLSIQNQNRTLLNQEPHTTCFVCHMSCYRDWGLRWHAASWSQLAAWNSNKLLTMQRGSCRLQSALLTNWKLVEKKHLQHLEAEEMFWVKPETWRFKTLVRLAFFWRLLHNRLEWKIFSTLAI